MPERSKEINTARWKQRQALLQEDLHRACHIMGGFSDIFLTTWFLHRVTMCPEFLGTGQLLLILSHVLGTFLPGQYVVLEWRCLGSWTQDRANTQLSSVFESSVLVHLTRWQSHSSAAASYWLPRADQRIIYPADWKSLQRSHDMASDSYARYSYCVRAAHPTGCPRWEKEKLSSRLLSKKSAENLSKCQAGRPLTVWILGRMMFDCLCPA